MAHCSLGGGTADLCALMGEAEYEASFDAPEDEDEEGDGAKVLPGCGGGPAPLN